MVYQKKTSNSNQLRAEREHFSTPDHHYNTRFSARNNAKRSCVPYKVLDFSNAQGDHYEENTYLVEDDNSSERFSTASLNSFHNSSEISRNSITANYCDQQIETRLRKFEKPMDFDGPPCPNDNRKWIRNGSLVLIVAVIAWYVNHVRVQLNRMQIDIESVNGRISDIVDARLDTLHQLSEFSNLVKDLKQSQSNFKFTIQKTIENEISKMYNDKTGRTDFALESAGGRIVQLSPGTENYAQPKSSLLGISLCDGMHGPRAIIQTGTSPGECWAFKGSSGGVIIKLLGSIRIDAVSLEHISKSISPSGDSTTAPKDFTVWGLKSVVDRGTLLGQFSYKLDGPPVQMFKLHYPIHDTFDFIELKVQSNHGNNDFTCVYRFRVHGIMENAKGK
ncbi:SUN domain-containing protein 1 [Dendroctonus ponderosae]|uniref:SUN domain-containing protein 1 n=1 Tax=Dendroctonus ponderosae TaxID=77166 RepID=UPI002034F406|nr:SUN domain-containing protein 1 [Dendroctonus ponderosae]KAH1025428.1 hypothetical protein HUJ05_010159 [Dendroctonus ponderosae]